MLNCSFIKQPLQVKKNSGFTLIEMVTVIVILGILSVGLSSFLQFGTQIYVDTTLRDHLISSGRFAVERLNREIRHALPNSPRVTGNCLEFYPIFAAARYVDIPVSPEADSAQITVRPFDDEDFPAAKEVAVYTANSNSVYGGTDHIHALDTATAIDKTDTEAWVITLNAAGAFEDDSPTERAYFIGDLVTYCISSGTLTREQSSGGPIVMARDVDNNSEFGVTDPSQTRNGLVEVELIFSALGETINFNNTTQVPNVP